MLVWYTFLVFIVTLFQIMEFRAQTMQFCKNMRGVCVAIIKEKVAVKTGNFQEMFV